MAHLDTESGEMVDDEDGAGLGTGGEIGEQDDAPTFAPPPIPAGNPLAQPAPAAIPGLATGNLEAPPLNNSGVVTHRVQLSDASKGALGALGANANATEATSQAQADNAKAAGDLAESKAADEAGNAQIEHDLKVQQIAETERLRAQHEERVRKLQARDDAEYEKFKAMGLKDPDADKGFAHALGAALAIGLGQYSAAINHTSNAAAKIFEDARADNYARQRAAIEHQKEVSVKAGTNVHEAEQREAEAMHNLQIKQVALIDSFRSRFKAESLRMGIPEARVNATKTMLELEQKANQEREKHLETGVRLLEPTNTVSRDMTAAELRIKGKGAGGGGAHLDELIAMKESGAADSAIAKRAQELKIPPKLYLPSIANVDRTRSRDAKDAKAAEMDPRTVMVAGKPRGLAPNARMVKNIEDRAVQYDDALESAKALLERRRKSLIGWAPVGSDYDRAVLAVAATTTANPSDATTKHEAGTLKNFGLVSEQGIKDTIAHLERRKAAFEGQLLPLGKEGGATLAAPEDKGAQVKARAQAVIDSPAYAKMDQAKKSYLLRAARTGQE